jgi:hypothetical protein
MTSGLIPKQRADIALNDDFLVDVWLATLDATEDTRATYRLGLTKFVTWLDGATADADAVRAWRAAGGQQ